jgi:CRISPR/Cas system-associated protein endoribonuclease Cas2
VELIFKEKERDRSVDTVKEGYIYICISIYIYISTLKKKKKESIIKKKKKSRKRGNPRIEEVGDRPRGR